MAAWSELARQQAGVVARRQLLPLGVTRSQVTWSLQRGQWQRLAAGVYLTHAGPVPEPARLWAALLRAGPEAVAGPRATLWLAGVVPDPPRPLDVCVPHGRHPEIPDVRVLRRSWLEELRHPVHAPPRLRLDVALLDVTADLRRPEQVVDLVLRVTQRRLSTADRIGAHLMARRAHPWRELLTDLTSDVLDGVQSPLERRYRDDVERAHGLPQGTRNRPETVDGSRRYRDVRYEDFDVVVELDGREAHPDDERFRSRVRDNRLARQGTHALRYGWREVAGAACGVAGEVAGMLRRGGWTGTLQPCRPGCIAHLAAEQ